MQLTKTFAPDVYAGALESWSWLPIADKSPIQATLFGDVFLQDAEGFWFLDAAGGKLDKVASTRDELMSLIASPEGRDQYLLGGLAEAAVAQGMQLGPTEVFDFKKPPVLGGRFEVANLAPRDFEVALNLSGQIHDQVRNLPPGTKISEIKIG